MESTLGTDFESPKTGHIRPRFRINMNPDECKADETTSDVKVDESLTSSRVLRYLRSIENFRSLGLLLGSLLR